MERLKNMELKKTFLVLSASCVLVALLMLGLVFMICNSISSNFPSGGIEILADGSIVKMETPTETQQNILSMLGIIQIVSCIVLPMGGLALSGILYYHIKLKQPISTLRNGISRIRNHDLDFSMPVHSDDELGQLCTAFDTMREELLKSNQELWRQAEERKRLNAAFSHDLRNPITVLKGTIKLLRQGTADEQAIDRLESYTLRIEQYAEAMSSIQRLEQMPVRINEYSYSLLHSELEETAKILAGALEPSVSAPDKGTIQLDHGLVLTVAENLIGNAARFAKSKIEIHLERKGNFLHLQSSNEMIESFEQIKMLCWVLIIFIGIIGILNIINTVYSNIHTRVGEIGMQRAIGMSAASLYKTFLWEGAYYGIIASVIGAVFGYVCCIFVGAAQTDALQLVAVPVMAIVEAAIISIVACLLATAIPLRSIARMSIVDSIETVE